VQNYQVVAASWSLLTAKDRLVALPCPRGNKQGHKCRLGELGTGVPEKEQSNLFCKAWVFFVFFFFFFHMNSAFGSWSCLLNLTAARFCRELELS